MGRPPFPAQVRPLPDLDRIAWAAGLYEGEGNANLTGLARTQVSVFVSQKDPWILKQLVHDWGGSIYATPYTVRGRSDKAMIYRWGLNARYEVARFVTAIWPYLSPRRKEQFILKATIANRREDFPEG